MASQRFRNFACTVYPDSAPDNWVDILADTHVPAFISPLHAFDVNPDGQLKKSHWHVLVMFEGVKSKDQWLEFRASFSGVGCEIVQSVRGYARYLCHMDNPEKYQYNPVEVQALSGAEIGRAHV